MPAAARLRTEPGTAITSIERSIAACAVISDPPRSRLSTTTSTSLSAARMRLRSGKRNASGAVPGGHSESSTPRPQTASHSSACWRGYGVSGPLPTTATGRPPSTARTPRWAAPSMPFAKPDTTLTPASARPRPSIAAISRPTPVALRVPTMPARRACRAARSPRTNSAAGGCGSWRNGAGNSGSRRVTTRMPAAAQRSAHSPGRRRSADARQADRSRGREEVGDGRRRTRLTGGHREGLDRIVVDEQHAEPGHGHQVEAGERGDVAIDGRRRGVDRHGHATSPAVAARSRARIDSAISTCSMSTASGGGRSGSSPNWPAPRSAIVRATRRIRW